ncbi:protein TIFY 5A-like [Trifolium pratense]|uniref:protein TIFY 5A-like n=1 Tax=Trifolium pratense TaxID=57577 RepID=UPI001E6982F2|nr:protein TIFY 5A-like [Trifolium pratense]
MRKNLNLELRLFPLSNSDLCNTMKEEEEEEVAESSESPLQDNQHRPLTIVYDGKICVHDATEIQARSILMFANKEMEERVRTPTGTSSEPSSPSVFNLYSPATSPSMKKSLQRFLHKRKNRIQEAAPYHRSQDK